MALPPNPNTFANNPLDRVSYKRVNADWVAEQLKNPDAFILPTWREDPFILPPAKNGEAPEVGFMRPGMFADSIAGGATVLFLGLDHKERPYFAIDLSEESDPSQQGALKGFGEFTDLRSIAPQIAAADAAIAAQAKAILKWHSTHQFCSACGAKSVIAEAGYRRDCPKCETQHFPRTDPVVIMLATYEDKALLGRQEIWPKAMFSALAGFVEPGESIEEAVARELLEEAGCKVSSVSYHSTQPWPYPMSLMIGCTAEADNQDVEPDGIEIAEARWCSRAELRDVLAGKGDGSLFVPPPFAIAHQLIRSWVDSDG